MILSEFKNIYDFDNLYKSFVQAAKGKRYRKPAMIFYANIEENLIQIQNELIWKSYELGDFYVFEVYEPKRRIINALPFRDRVVQIALCNVIEPYIDQRFIYDSYACRKRKGSLKAANRISYFLGKPENTKYLKCDISKFFYSIDLNLLLSIIEKRYIKDENILWLLKKILLKDNPYKGIKIGNRFSQLAANIYLHELDFYIKNTLKVKYYARYMDDFIVLGRSKSILQSVLSDIQYFLQNELCLDLNEKTHIGNCRDGIDFVGYKIFPKNKIIKKQSMNRTRNIINGWIHRKVSNKALLASISSRCGHATGTASYKFYMDALLKILHKKLLK